MSDNELDALAEVSGSFDSPKKKGGSLKWIIIILLVGLIMGGGGFFAGKMFFGTKDGGKDSKPSTEDQPGAGDKVSSADSEKTTPGVIGSGKGILSIEPFSVNLDDPFGQRIVHAELKLVIEKKDWVQQIKDNELVMPKIKNEILMTVSSRKFEDLRSMNGKEILFEEIMMRINEVIKIEMGFEPVVEVLQTKFIVQ